MQWYNNDGGSRLCLLYVLRTLPGEERREEKRSIFARASAILFTVDITHMRSFQYIHYLGKQGKTKRFPTAGWLANEHVPSAEKGGYGVSLLSGKQFVSRVSSNISDDSLYAQWLDRQLDQRKPPSPLFTPNAHACDQHVICSLLFTYLILGKSH